MSSDTENNKNDSAESKVMTPVERDALLATMTPGERSGFAMQELLKFSIERRARTVEEDAEIKKLMDIMYEDDEERKALLATMTLKERNAFAMAELHAYGVELAARLDLFRPLTEEEKAEAQRIKNRLYED